MNAKHGFFILLVFLAISGACHRSCKTPQTLAFKPPEIPLFIVDQQAKTEYFMAHFWDNYPFSDTLCLAHRSYTEQLFAQFAQLLNHVDESKNKQAIHHLFEKVLAPTDSSVRSKMYYFFSDIATRIFYDPNSPLRNEDYYLCVLEYALSSAEVPDYEKQRCQNTVLTVMKNRPGTRAADFTFAPAFANVPYTANDNETQTLYSLQVPYLLVFFNNPYCQACEKIIKSLQKSTIVLPLVKAGKLKILALYPDEDLEQWNEYLPNMPKDWINAYNPDCLIKNNNIYDLRAIPTLYLLDRDKTVLLKDPNILQLYKYLAYIVP